MLVSSSAKMSLLEQAFIKYLIVVDYLIIRCHLSFLTGSARVCKTCSAATGGTAGLLHEKRSNPYRRTLVYSVCVARHLKAWEET